ncbi:putative bifunctional diguanylate cyclase/phosphodiesterase [Aquisalimonas asiatica]|uniref:EAL domain, c-di-GMP-specific phosphodiesterase class I (Or its enzymatically inactive variant) n=1 Tax=Aquisalimonas asiatica TaxID=406100 RepID=A0A1H8Q5B2_9GAMM|nr:sensor domain-containing phosphodiesterase [Aquisalimonas asiatica]SEO49208.1 EAL domain, c-di-GMP-specific phosphodiesterase class I (or its enzymatically inactive variant) [Aquisalimonas asiatica]
MAPDGSAGKHSSEPEAKRLQEVLSLELLDTQPEERFDQYTRLIADVLNMPIALIALMDEQRQWFKSRHGLAMEQTPRSISFCRYAMTEEYLEVRDAAEDERFRDTPLVTDEPHVRFYAGAVLHGPTGEPVGTVCVLDRKPRKLGPTGRRRLQAFALLVEQELAFNARLSEAREEIEQRALRDPVTGLPRRSIMMELLGRALAHADGGIVAVAHIYFPRFEEVLSVYGRERLDYTAQLLTERVRTRLHHRDYIGRVDDGTLMVVLTGLESQQVAVDRVTAICEGLRTPYYIGGGQREVVVAFGVSLSPDDGTDAETLADKARLAGRQAEKSGHQWPVFYSGGMNDQVSRRDRIARRLARALEQQELELYYQPVLCLDTGKVAGCEALARWYCPQLGWVSPGEFIPIVEQDPALSRELTAWVLETACRQASEWRQRLAVPFWISVNVSGNELHRPEFPDLVEGLLHKYALTPGALVIELTEQSMIQDVAAAVEAMNRLGAMGIQFAVDDFGSGYSSLNYLRELPLGKLKIDRAFMQDLGGAGVGREVVRAIINVGQALGMTVVAEGVETPEQAQVLCDLGCNEVQGFLMRPPVPAGVLEAMVAEGAAIPWVWEEKSAS